MNVNGQLVSRQLVDLNRGYRYGDGLFETMVGTEGKLPLWKYHMVRLLTGMRGLGYKISHLPGGAETFFANQVQMVLPAHGSHRVRLLVHRAGGGTYAPAKNDFAWCVQVDPLASVSESAPPLRVGFFHAVPLVPSPISRFKTTSALVYVQAARYAQRHGFDEVLLSNVHGRPVEGCAHGLVIREGNRLIAPPHAEGGVWSTYTSYLEEEGAAKLGYDFRYRRLTLDDLRTADDVFLVNAVRGIRPVKLVAFGGSF